MNILVLGSGGREHAICHAISKSKLLTRLYIAPGNAGTHRLGKNIEIDPENFDAVAQLVLQERIDMIVVGPEAPLVKGIQDFFRNDARLSNVMIIGPSQKGAMLEGSKDFAKAFMHRHNIPTASHFTVTQKNLSEGIEFLASMRPPYVLKADGLAAGKGVIIIPTLEEARKRLIQMIEEREFGTASEKVLIEEYLEGIELSVFVLTDGRSFLLLPEAKDYKRVGEGDTGPNTGGMGAVSPVPFVTAEFMEKVVNSIIQPTIRGLQEEGIEYQGFIFFGLMNVNGKPYVIEYNCRLGDPEAEVIFPRIQNDLLQLLTALFKGELPAQNLLVDTRAAATVFLVSGGYPGKFEKNFVIEGLDSISDSILFHAGTRLQNEYTVTSGGRVIAVTSLAPTIQEAVNISVRNAEKIHFTNKYYRRDIGYDLLKFV